MGDLQATLLEGLRSEADGCYSWSGGPGEVYGRHHHGYDKVLYCVAGSITFSLPGGNLHLEAGDRMVLASGTRHSAQVGPLGCTCIEGRGRTLTSG